MKAIFVAVMITLAVTQSLASGQKAKTIKAAVPEIATVASSTTDRTYHRPIRRFVKRCVRNRCTGRVCLRYRRCKNCSDRCLRIYGSRVHYSIHKVAVSADSLQTTRRHDVHHHHHDHGKHHNFVPRRSVVKCRRNRCRTCITSCRRRFGDNVVIFDRPGRSPRFDDDEDDDDKVNSDSDKGSSDSDSDSSDDDRWTETSPIWIARQGEEKFTLSLSSLHESKIACSDIRMKSSQTYVENQYRDGFSVFFFCNETSVHEGLYLNESSQCLQIMKIYCLMYDSFPLKY